LVAERPPPPLPLPGTHRCPADHPAAARSARAGLRSGLLPAPAVLCKFYQVKGLRSGPGAVPALA